MQKTELKFSTMVEKIGRARLPEVYKNAQSALATCADLDECKDWADHAEALASYARQAKDPSLQRLARRIQVRAVNRIGELIKLVPSAQGQRNDLSDPASPSRRAGRRSKPQVFLSARCGPQYASITYHSRSSSVRSMPPIRRASPNLLDKARHRDRCGKSSRSRRATLLPSPINTSPPSSI